MSKKDKIIERVLSVSNDITFEELTRFLKIFGYFLYNKGKTSGSRVIFKDDTDSKIYMHKPHPSNIVKKVYIVEIIDILVKEGKL